MSSTIKNVNLLIAGFYGSTEEKNKLREALTNGRDLSSFDFLIKTYEESIQKTNAYCLNNNVHIIHYGDAHYPALLKEIPDFPFVLYGKGDVALLNHHHLIGIVGTRRATSYSLSLAERLSAELSRYNFVVVSGLAEGIDTAAHKGALAGNEKTIAVLGHGIDHVFPVSNRELYAQIAKTGLLLTEFPPGHPADKWTFPQRNRIIAGLTLGTLVVESADSGGSLITADQALQYNREVFAVPGRPDDAFSIGPNKLIQKGAKLVLSVQDILEELTGLIPKNKLTKSGPVYHLTPQEQGIYDALSTEPRHIDDIALAVQVSVGTLMSVLSFLALQHVVRELPGKYFVRV